MAAYGSHSTVSIGTRTNTTITAPSGIADGDLLLLLWNGGASAAVTPTPPSGFASANGAFPITQDKADPWIIRSYCWFKVASGESGNYTVTHSSASTEAVLYRLTGADPTTPVPQVTNATGSSGTGLTATGVTTSGANSLIIFNAITWDGTTAGGASPPTGTTPTFTERFDCLGTGNRYTAEGPVAGAGTATGNKSITAAVQNGPWSVQLIEVQSPTGGGGETTLPPVPAGGVDGAHVMWDQCGIF